MLTCEASGVEYVRGLGELRRGRTLDPSGLKSLRMTPEDGTQPAHHRCHASQAQHDASQGVLPIAAPMFAPDISAEV